MNRFFAAMLVAGSLVLPAAQADDAHRTSEAGATQASQSLSEGVVRKVDKDANKITLRHGPLQNLDMPAMTMVFQVKDPAMLDQVKAGDKVRFRAEKPGGAYTLVEIHPVK